MRSALSLLFGLIISALAGGLLTAASSMIGIKAFAADQHSTRQDTAYCRAAYNSPCGVETMNYGLPLPYQFQDTYRTSNGPDQFDPHFKGWKPLLIDWLLWSGFGFSFVIFKLNTSPDSWLHYKVD